MAACESPFPENPDLSLLWTNKMNTNANTNSSFGDIFREPPPPLFHHPETSMPFTSSLWSSLSDNDTRGEELNPFLQRIATSHKKSESLQLCTEGLGFESFDYVEDNLSTSQDEDPPKAADTSKQIYTPRRRRREFRRSSSVGGGYPPPIPSISVSGKPWVCFKSYRHEGRFVLKEERIPTQEVLHASRVDGRLRLHFVHRPEEEVQTEDPSESNKEEEINIGVDEKDDS